MVTGTVVVDENGDKPSVGSTLLRSLIRFIPFEAFTAFSSSGQMWHDSWTKTHVVKIK